MKKIISSALLLLAMGMPLQAQVYKDVDKTPKERLDDFLGETEQGMKKAGKTIGDFLGINSKTETDEVEVDGVRYMPLHTVNVFYADSTGMIERCRTDFARRYPRATILSVAIPQETWTETVVKENKRITAYKRTAYCYVLGRDGADGYINARYVFRQQRKPGNRWVSPASSWPGFERADAIPNIHFSKLNKH